MIESDFSNVVEGLEEHNYLQECVLLGIDWGNYFTTVDLMFNSIWNHSKLRQNLENERLVRLRFERIRQFSINNSYTPDTLGSVNKLNWGFNEVSCVEIQLTTVGGVELVRSGILWEINRRGIEILCGKVSFSELT